MADRRPIAGPVLLLLLLSLAGCTTVVSGMATAPAGTGTAVDTAVRRYFDQLNASGDQGPAAQAAFFSRTQHPDFADRACGLHGLTLTEDPAMGTLRLDPAWDAPGTTTRPRGTIYLIAVSITIRRIGATVGNQIGAVHLILLDGALYGFAPCSTS